MTWADDHIVAVEKAPALLVAQRATVTALRSSLRRSASSAGGKPQVNRWRRTKQLPDRTELSDALSKELKHRGFRSVGWTICYAFMQAIGVVNNRATDCFRYRNSASAREEIAMDEITQPLEKVAAVTTDATELAIRFGPSLAVAVAIFAVGWFFGAWLGRATDRMMQRTDVDVTARLLLVRIVRIVVLALFLIMALQNLGVELLPLLAGLGIAGVGVTLAMQGVLSNVAAGLTIILTRPFKVGDYISIAGEEGCVEEINLFSTRLGHSDLSRVVIPNRKIAGEILHNYGRIRQLDLIVGVAYDTDLARALRLIEGVLAGNSALLKDPAPVVQVIRLAESSIEIAVKPWVTLPDYGAAQGAVNKTVVEALQRDGITLPFPRRDIRILSGVA